MKRFARSQRDETKDLSDELHLHRIKSNLLTLHSLLLICSVRFWPSVSDSCGSNSCLSHEALLATCTPDNDNDNEDDDDDDDGDVQQREGSNTSDTKINRAQANHVIGFIT